jgi:hypothetical protein
MIGSNMGIPFEIRHSIISFRWRVDSARLCLARKPRAESDRPFFS